MADDLPADAGLYASTAAAARRRRDRRLKQAAVGLAGAAAVLAGAGFLVSQLMSVDQDEVPEPAALPPMALTTSATAPTTPSMDPHVMRTPKGFKPAEPVERSPVPSPTPSDPPAPAGSAEGGTEERGTGEGASGRGATGESTGVSERTETLENGTIRIMTARRDLSGSQELALARDRGQVVASGVRCTGDVRLPTGVPAERRPTLLLCWRTSATRSVITMAVVPRGEWPAASSVAVIGREWARLG